MGCHVSRDLKRNQLSEVLREEQILLVRTTWNVLAEDLEETGVIIIGRLIENERMLRPLFLSLSTQPGVAPTRLRLLDKEKLRRHGTVVMEALGAAVESLDDAEYLNDVLYGLGQTHANYNVTADMLPKLWPAINYGLAVRLQESYTAEVREAWKSIFRFIVSKMEVGIREYEETLKEKEQIAKENQQDNNID